MRHIRRANENVGRKLCVSDTMREQLRYEDEIRGEYEARGIGVDTVEGLIAQIRCEPQQWRRCMKERGGYGRKWVRAWDGGYGIGIKREGSMHGMK